MKAYYFLIATLLFAACKKDLLNTKPYDAVASSTMWTTENLTDLGVTGVYSALNNSTVAGRELYTMDQYSYVGQCRNAQALLMGTASPSDALFSDNWAGLYEGIQRANDAIKNIPNSPAPGDKKARYLAECKFLRAYFYMRLNQLWKGVPIYLEPYNDAEAIRPRASEAEVWNTIITDLTEAINEPQLPGKYPAGDVKYGHATKGAAYALRGKAYLYIRQWDKAINDFKSVKEIGYNLFNNYTTLFKTINEQCNEMIFSVQNLELQGYGSSSQLRCGSRSSFGSGFNTYLISPNLVDLYEYKNGAPFNWDNVIPGYSAMPAAKREVYFYRNNLTAAEITAATKKGLDMSLYLPTGNEQRILSAYADRDPRLYANVITPYSSYNGVFGSANSTVTYRLPLRSDAPPTQDLRTDLQGLFYYLHRKFVYEGNAELLYRTASPTDMPLIRYADVLLMWAEALNEKQFDAEAINLVNEVRGRVGVNALQNSNAALPTYVAGQADLRERIRNERRREFPNEGINYFDELRWQTVKEKIFYTGNGGKHIWGTNQFTYLYPGDHILAWPIPQVEIERNSNMVQNPGWSN